MDNNNNGQGSKKMNAPLHLPVKPVTPMGTPYIIPLGQVHPPGTDYVGMWYTARLRHQVDDRMLFGTYENGASKPHWYSASHRYYDGIAGVVMLLESKGMSFPEGLAKGRDKTAPTLREIWRAGRRPLDAPSGRPLWRVMNTDKVNAAPVMPVTQLLSVAETAAIEAVAKKAGVSSTIWLLWAADRAVRELMCEPGSVMPWVYPVNLRGAARQERESMNHCGGFAVTISDGMDAAAVRDQISARLARLEHWRQWLLLNLGKLVGQSGINLLYRLSKGRPGAFAGSYSNLGSWRAPSVDGLTASAPGSPAYPVCITTAVCNDRRTLAIRVHPVADSDGLTAARVLARWREKLLDQD